VKVKIALVLIAAALFNMSWPVQAQVPQGPYPAPPLGPGYPPPGYPSPPMPPGYGEAQWAHCQELEQAQREIAGRLQFTPPGLERAQMEQSLRDISAARQPCWPR